MNKIYLIILFNNTLILLMMNKKYINIKSQSIYLKSLKKIVKNNNNLNNEIIKKLKNITNQYKY